MEFSKQSGIYRLHSQHFLPISLEEAWRFFSSPKNLQKITPENLNFNITSPENGEAYLGQIITYTISLNKIFKMNWVTEITHITKGSYFVDEQRFGPYKMWHHLHKIEEVNGGVLMTDVVHFKLPFSMVAPLAYSLFVKRKLTEIFRFRTKKLDELIASNQLV
jgi:ligand-binding SRPBCC domain-containing protein